METRFTVLTSFGIDGNDYGKKALYIVYKKKLILYRYFKEVQEIQIEKGLNHLYFSWLEEESKIGGVLWG